MLRNRKLTLRAFKPGFPGLCIAARLCFMLVALGPVTYTQAGLFDDDEARKAIIELRARVEIIERDFSAKLNQLGQRHSELQERVEKLESRLDATQRGQLELQGQIESLRREMAELRGKLEVQTNELTRTQLQYRELNSSIENRLSGVLEGRLSALDARIKKLEPNILSVTIDDKPVNVEAEEKRQYDAALALVRGSEFRTASVAFSQFIARHPESPYLANAMFWNANALFGMKDYRAAATANEKFLSKFNDHPKAADAALSLAFAQIELNERPQARKSLETVIEKFPNSEAAKHARDRLSTLKR